MTRGLRIALGMMGPTLTILFIFMSKERPLDDIVQLMSLSFGVSGVVLGVGYAVARTRGMGLGPVLLTTGIGLALVWGALLVSAAFSAEVRGWLPILLVTAPVFTFPSVFGAALATCGGRSATSSSPSQTAS